MNHSFKHALIVACLATTFATVFLPLTIADDDLQVHDNTNMTQHKMVGDLVISNPWTRAMPSVATTGGGFVTITNTGQMDDRFISAQSSVGDVAEIHEMSVTDDVMRMQSLPNGLVIPAGQTIEFKPGSYHIMFFGVQSPFTQGDLVPVTLNFQNAGDIDLMLPVAQMGSSTPPMDHASHAEHVNSGDHAEHRSN